MHHTDEIARVAQCGILGALAGHDAQRDLGEVVEGEVVEVGLLAQELRGSLRSVAPEALGITHFDSFCHVVCPLCGVVRGGVYDNVQ